MVALPPGESLAGFACIGVIEPLAGGVALRGRNGVVTALEERGFNHFDGG